MAIGAISDQMLHGLLQRLRGGFGIAERCSELTICKFKVSSVVVEGERRILLALGEIRDLFRKYAPQLLDVFKLKVIPQYCIAHPYCAQFLRH